MNNNNTDPTPAPPLEGRGSATAGEVNPQGTALPLKGRGRGGVCNLSYIGWNQIMN